MFRTIRDYFKIQKILKAIYHNENLTKNLSQIFGVPCNEDWVGRLYMLVNPVLQNIESDGNAIIYDHNDNRMVEAWVMKNLELSRNFVTENQLFDIMTYSITKYDDDDNYLVVFKNIFFDDVVRIVRWFGVGAGILIVAGILLLVL